MEEGEWRRIIHPDIEQLSLVEIELGLLPDGDIADGAHFLHEVDHEVLLLVPGDSCDSLSDSLVTAYLATEETPQRCGNMTLISSGDISGMSSS